MQKNESLIELKNVIKCFNGSIQKFTALNNVNMVIKKGEFVVLTGKSGSGKSTLLNMISGIDVPTSGHIIVNNVPLHNMSGNQLAIWRGTNIGIVFQFFQLLPTLTVLENVILPMEFAGIIPISQQRKRGIELLESVGLQNQLNKYPNLLSGGEKQRVAIARSLANNPKIIVADEPTGNLDSFNAEIIYDLFNFLNQQGKTIIYVTHDRNINLNYTRIVKLVDGQIDEIIINEESQFNNTGVSL